MANPYHDEAGRFSSKDEMGAAVDRLYAQIGTAKNPVELATATDAWFELRTEFEAAQKDEAALASAKEFYSKPLTAQIGAPADLYNPRITEKSDAVGSVVPDKTEAKRSGRPDAGGSYTNLNENEVASFAKMLHQRPTADSEGYMNDFYNNASPETKVAVVKEYLGHPLDGVRISDSLARGLLENEGLHNDDLVAYALSSEMPFEDRVELARATGRLAYLAAGRPSAFTRDDALETELISELRRRGRNGDVTREQQSGWAALAAASKRRSTIDEVFEKFGSYDNYDPKVISELAQNPHLNSDQQAELLRSIAWNDTQNFGPLAGRIAGSAYKIKTAENKARSDELSVVVKRHTEIMSGADSSSFVNLTPSQARSAHGELARLTGIEAPSNEVKARIAHFTAVLDAQDGDYNGLKKQVAVNEEQLKKHYVEADHFANERTKRRLFAATAVRAADIAAGEYADRYYSS